MSDPDDLLRRAIGDNIGWCDSVARAHGGDTALTADLWRNRRAPPPFYPNLITARRGAQADVAAAVDDLRPSLPPGWGVKDSFADLDLTPHGFRPLLKGTWYGGTVTAAPPPPGWHRIETAAPLARWEAAWNPGHERRIFPDSLLGQPHISFWGDSAAALTAGCVTHATAAALGLSNWFHRDGEASALAAAIAVASTVAAGRPIVFWSAEAVTAPGFAALGPLCVWLAAAPA